MRSTRYGIDDAFLRRFSPRTFTDKMIAESDLLALIEAASTAPSCFNEQPWRFVLGDKEDFLAVLTRKNFEWARNAPLLMLVCSTLTFARNAKPNRWHAYDSGTAMGYLILEALRRGIYVHPMGGFKVQEAKDRFGLLGLEAHAVLALGYTQESDAFSPRFELGEIIVDRREE